MTPKQFFAIFGDGIQFHEGWTEGEAAYTNLSPGNLNFDHQLGAIKSPAGRARFASFYAGKLAELVDVEAKFNAGLNTIREIVTRYAPPAENDTEAYITAIVEFFAWRNIQISADTPIDQFISSFAKPVVLMVIDNLYAPADWHAIQQAVSQCASYMTDYAFACEYSNVDLTSDVIQIDQPLISATTSVIDGNATKQVLEQFNDGEALNILIYNGTVMQGHPTPAGGCEYQGVRIDPVSSEASVMYQGAAFVDPTARGIFHELQHQLFELTKQPDVVHAILIAGKGYAANAIEDLLTCFNGNNLNTPQAIAALKAEKANL